MRDELRENRTPGAVLADALKAAASLVLFGFGVFLTIRADIGAAPWDVLNLGLSGTLGILYGSASIAVSLSIVLIDVLLKEPIGVAMILDALVVGKAVDFLNRFLPVPPPASLAAAIPMMLAGLTVMAYSQYFYMNAALGCGPRDTLLVALAKRVRRVPIGAISVALLGTATLAGWLLGGPVGIGTLICAFCTGPIMQLAFRTVGFDATAVRHQRLRETLRVLFPKR